MRESKRERYGEREYVSERKRERESVCVRESACVRESMSERVCQRRVTFVTKFYRVFPRPATYDEGLCQYVMRQCIMRQYGVNSDYNYDNSN